MNCALCLNDRPLVKSHIISELLYETVFDEKHQYFEYPLRTDVFPKRQNTGKWEKLLCNNCDNVVLGEYETYGAIVLKAGKGSVGLTAEIYSDSYFVKGVDYRKFKLFELSQFWRWAVSREARESGIQISAEHKEDMRQMLLHGDPKEPTKYGCALCVMTVTEGEEVIRNIMIPICEMQSFNGYRMFQGIFSTIVWAWFLPTNGSPFPFPELLLNKEGGLPIKKLSISVTESFKGFYRYASQFMPTQK